MMKVNQFLFALVIAATAGLAGQVGAQSAGSTDDGIAASPRVRQMLDERKPSAKATAMSAGPNGSASASRAGRGDGIAASPKLRQQLNERAGTPTVAPAKCCLVLLNRTEKSLCGSERACPE